MDKKSICLVTASHLQTENAICNRVLSLVNGFLDAGYRVELISMDEDNYQLLTHPDFYHHKIPFINTKISSFMKRSLLEAKIAYSAIRKANTTNADIKLLTIPSMFLLHLSFLLNNKSRQLLDIRDLNWEYLSDRSLTMKFVKSLLRLSATLNFKNFEQFSVTNKSELDYLSQYTSNSKVSILPNGVSIHTFNTLSKLPQKITDDSKPITITYIGNIGLGQNLTTLIEAAQELPDHQFNIVGGGTDFERVKSAIATNQSNVQMTGQVGFAEVVEAFQKADILYAQLSKDYAGAVPSKLYEYLSTGKPIIYGGSQAAEELLSEFEGIQLVEPENAQALVNAISVMVDQKKTLASFTLNQEKIAAFFIRERNIAKFIKDLGFNNS